MIHQIETASQVRNWAGFDPAAEEGILSLPNLVNLISLNPFTRRLDPDYISHGMYFDELFAFLTELGKVNPFWALPEEP